MATEKFANDAESTLDGSINNAVTSLDVTDASPFPPQDQFRIKIDSEIMLVTGVAGATFTVLRGQEGTTAASHTDQAPITHVLTSGALAQALLDNFNKDGLPVTMLWAADAVTPRLAQANEPANSATGDALTIQAQNATGTTSTGGALNLTSGTGTTVAGNVDIQTGGVSRALISPTLTTLSNDLAVGAAPATTGTIRLGTGAEVNFHTGTVNYGAIYGSGGTLYFGFSSSSGYATTTHIRGSSSINVLTGNGYGMVINAVNGSIATQAVGTGFTFTNSFASGTACYILPIWNGTTRFGFNTTVTAAVIAQDNRTTNSATGAPFTIQAQNATGTTSTGGALNLTSGTGTSAHGNVNIQVGGTSVLSASTSALTVLAPETINAGTATGEARSAEGELTTSDSSDHPLATYAIPTDSTLVLDIEVLAIPNGAGGSRWWKKSRAFLNDGGTIVDGAQKDVDSETLGTVLGTWTVTIDSNAGNARVQVNSDGTTVRWYIISQRVRVLAAP